MTGEESTSNHQYTAQEIRYTADEFHAIVGDFPDIVDALRAFAALLEQRERYAKINPLGGPAKVFDAIAQRLRAGEEYNAVLADYDLYHRQPELTE